MVNESRRQPRSYPFTSRESPVIALAGITEKSCTARGQTEGAFQQYRMWIQTADQALYNTGHRLLHLFLKCTVPSHNPKLLPAFTGITESP